VAQKGGALPAFAELEAIRLELAVPVRRFCARLGIPVSTWYHWRAGELSGRPVRRWPAPVVDRIEESAAETAHRWSAWGHRKIWAMLRADGVYVSRSSVERALRRRGLLQPLRYQAERRQLAVARRATFVQPPVRRNRVWQMDFSEFETGGGGVWRLAGLVDYATKLCLAASISGTTAARDACAALEAAIAEAEQLIGSRLADDCLDHATGELMPLAIVTDNGPAFKSVRFAGFIRARPYLGHIRTRHRAPETNGVVERFFATLKYEHLYREEIANVVELAAETEHYRQIYNAIRPHEAIDFATPLSRYLAPPEPHLSEAQSVQES
jgi:putative transposase